MWWVLFVTGGRLTSRVMPNAMFPFGNGEVKWCERQELPVAAPTCGLQEGALGYLHPDV